MDFTTTLDAPTIEHVWKLPKNSGNRTQYSGKKYVIAFSQCEFGCVVQKPNDNFSLVNSGQKKLTKRLCERIDGIHTSSINEYTTHLGLFLKYGFYTTAFVNVSESLF